MIPKQAIIFLGDLEERLFSECDISPLVQWQYIKNIFMLWQHGEKELKKFSEILNSYHPTIISTATYSRQKVCFLEVEVIKKEHQLATDLYKKPTDTHKYLHASSTHAFHSEKSEPQSQALSLNRICSENQFFDKRSNNLEIWLKGRRYSDKLFRKQILKARKFSRAELLNNQRKKDNEDTLFFNVTYGSIKTHNDENTPSFKNQS